jgi:DDE family transposase
VRRPIGIAAAPTRNRLGDPVEGVKRGDRGQERMAAVKGDHRRPAFVRLAIDNERRRAKRGETVERAFAHILDRGGMRRAWLRGRENVHKRYLIHVAGFNLGLLMRALYGKGTPKEAAEARHAIVLVLRTDTALTFALIAVIDGEPAALVIAIATNTN